MIALPLYGLDGFIFHLAIVGFEIDSHLLVIFVGLATYWSGIFACLASNPEVGLIQAARQTMFYITTFNGSLWTSIAVHRLFFHRLRSFPGPFFAKLTRLWAFWVQKEDMQMHLIIHRLHDQHGDIVRIGPREISIRKSAAIPIIYGPSSKCTKSPWYSRHNLPEHDNGLINLRDPSEHRRRRRAWDRGLNAQSLSVYEPRVESKADSLICQLRLQAHSESPINMTAWCGFFAFDVMGDIGLGKDFQSVETGTEHPAMTFIHLATRIVALGGTLPWLMRLRTLFPRKASAGYIALIEYSSERVFEKQRTLVPDSKPQDVISWLVKARFAEDKSAPSQRALQEDARLLIIAGSDTTASVLVNAVYYLTSHPKVTESLQKVLDIACPDGAASWSYTAIKQIPLLDYIIHETLRLAPPTPGGITRLSPKEGLIIDDVYIPGNVVVSVPMYTIHRDERYFERAEEFITERWAKEGLVHGPDASMEGYNPFTQGAYACVGRQAAWMELKTALSKLFLNFDFAFESAEGADYFGKNQKDTFTLTVPPLKMILTERRGKETIDLEP
ncbi:putative benzoate 4-monooxygenase cytochrome P450 [Flagelloscypha sp. PMI_526]|nr:putative benzoate 4-monooxygenase cytochrome P450 [Flagelloscypha sp. PMI_526]